MLYRYVVIDSYKYAVQQGTYIRKWERQFTATLAANIVELNFVDKGPGIKHYNFTLLLNTWDTTSQPYKDGVTQTLDQQRTNLEASYLKVATAVQFLDPFGEAPTLGGVYFTSLNENLPPYSTVEKPYLLMDIELVESKTAF
jgi:hypothetical protein